MKDMWRNRGSRWRVVGAVTLGMMAAVAFAVVALDGGVAEFTEAAVIPDDAEVAWLDGWEFTNGTASLMLSPSFSAARIFIGAEATDAPVAGTFAADGSGIDAVVLVEESDGWYTNTLSVADPNIVEVGVALTGDDAELARVIALPIREVGNDDSSLQSIPPAGELMGEMPLGSGTPTATAPALVPGLVSEFYLASKNGGNYPGIPDFSLISPTFIKTDTTINFKSNGSWTGVPAAYKDYFASRHTGFIDIPADKTYTFYLQSDDGSMLYIDDELVVNNGGLHGLAEKSGSVYLAAGLHAIRIEYVESAGTAQLVLRWSATGINKAVVPASVFYSYPYAGTIPPSVWLRSPAAGAIYKHLEPITLTAEALDLDGSVTSVSFYDGDELLATLSSAPYEFVWTNQAPREVHALTALAVDADGNTRRTPPLEVTTVVRPAGLDFGADISFYSFSQNPTNLPDFSALTPFATGVVERLSNPWTQAPWTSSTYSSYLRDRFGVVIEGYILVRENCRYSFKLTSDDGARLIIGNTIVIDRDGLRGGDGTASRYVDFIKGIHPFKVEYFQSTGGKSLSLTCTDARGGVATIAGDDIMHVADPIDSDGDGMPDWWEIYYELNPHSGLDADIDIDGDGLNNAIECQNRTNPRVPDTDGDGMPDDWELAVGLDPVLHDGALDADNDGLANSLEYRNGANPYLADSDNDGYSDAVECLEIGSDPSASSTLTTGQLIPCSGEKDAWYFVADEVAAYEVQVEVAQSWHDYTLPATSVPDKDRFLLAVDGRQVATRRVNVVTNGMLNIIFYTPILSIGRHSISITSTHIEHRLKDEIIAVSVVPYSCSERDMVDIVGFSCPTGVVTSYVSPAFIEGTSRHPSLVYSDFADVQVGGTYTWYMNLSSLSTNATEVQVVCESVVTGKFQVVWSPYNLFVEASEMKIIGGSSMLFGGLPDGVEAGRVEIFTNGTIAAEYYADEVVSVVFPSNEVVMVAAVLKDDGENVVDESGGLSVVCINGAFPLGCPACMLETRREWSCPDLPRECVLETDLHTRVDRKDDMLGLFVDSTIGDRIVCARLYEGGPILDAAFVNPIWVIDSYGNNCRLISSDEVGDICRCTIAQYGVDESVTLSFRMYTSAVCFDDYTSTRVLSVADFPADGFYTFDMLKSSSTSSPCHYLYVYQNGVFLGEALYGKPILPAELK